MQIAHGLRRCLSLIAALAATSVPGTAQCPDWKRGFDLAGVNGEVRALAVFDDGTGPALFAGGDFMTAGSMSAERIAKWDGASWSAVGSGGMNGEVHALAVFDDGTGPALFAGGSFTSAGGVSANHLAKWDGVNWSSLVNGVDSTVRALAVFNDGTGPALFAGGDFTSAGGASANFLAKWDGASWSPAGNSAGGGVDGSVHALAAFDDGTGSSLFAGGDFGVAGGVSASRIAKWDGAGWSALGNGLNDQVRALAVHDDGTGRALFAGGAFTSSGIASADYIARWDGASWSAPGGGVNGFVNALAVFDDGTGPALFAGGGFWAAGSVSANFLARWDGTRWSELGLGTDVPVNALAVFDGGAGPALFAGGDFQYAGSLFTGGIAMWDGESWSALGNGLDRHAVKALAVFDDGSGPALFAGGDFRVAGGALSSCIAKWDGTSWSDVARGVSSDSFDDLVVNALAVFDDGTGPALFAGGKFMSAGGVGARHIAKWDGASWSGLGAGLYTAANALAVFDDGTGPALFVGGIFNSAGPVNANFIARWDGTSWSPLGNGLNYPVNALAVFDDGTGPALFAGGSFRSAGGVAASRIAKWNGTSWSPLGSGVNKAVNALAVFDDGTGPALFAGGLFTSAGGVSASHIAKWDGASWSPVGNSGGSGVNKAVSALAVLDDGTGPAIFAGGTFTTAGGVTARAVAKWDGTSWSGLGASISGPVRALAPFDDGTDSHADLYIGGDFAAAGGNPSFGIAQWFGGRSLDTDLDGLLDCADNCPGDFNPGQDDCNGDGLGDICAIAAGASVDANLNGIPDECEGSLYCTGKTNSMGCVPFIRSLGFASVTSPSPFQVMASDCLPGHPGLLLYGHAKSNLDFHGGKLCVSLPFVRIPGGIALDPSAPCKGILRFDMNKRIQSGVDPMLTAGAQVYAQWRQRDPNDPAGFADSLTNALTFMVQP